MLNMFKERNNKYDVMLLDNIQYTVLLTLLQTKSIFQLYLYLGQN